MTVRAHAASVVAVPAGCGTSTLSGTSSGTTSRNSRERKHSAPRQAALADADAFREIEIGFAFGQHAIRKLNIGEEAEIEMAQVVRRPAAPREVQGIDADRGVRLTALGDQPEGLCERRKLTLRHEFEARGEAEPSRPFAESRKIVEEARPVGIGALHQCIAGAELRTEREGRHEIVELRRRLQIECVDVEHRKICCGERLLHLPDQRRVADHGVIGKFRRGMEAQAHAVIAAIAGGFDEVERPGVHQRRRSEKERVQSGPRSGAWGALSLLAIL